MTWCRASRLMTETELCPHRLHSRQTVAQAGQALHFTVLPASLQLSRLTAHAACPGAAGGSGTGKSTTLRLMAGLLEPDSGQVVVQARSPVPAGILVCLFAGFNPRRLILRARPL